MAKETQIKAYECEKCGRVHIDENVVNTCCKIYSCDICGCENIKYVTRCYSCREKKRYSEAKKITLKEYEEKYPNNMVVYNDDYYDIDDAIYKAMDDYLDMQDFTYPPVIWGTDLQRIELNLDSIIESALEDSYEDADFGDEAYKELKVFLDSWNKTYGLNCFFESSLAIELPVELIDEYINEGGSSQ